MRKEILVGLATLSLSMAVSGAQRAAAPAIPAPAPAMHAMPAPAPAHVPVAAGTHAPVAPGNHLASPHGPTATNHVPIRGSSVPAHTGTHAANPSAAAPHRPNTTAGMPVNPIAPVTPGVQKPFIPGYLPGDAFTGQSCYFGNCYPVPGFGFDYEHFFAVHPNWNKYQSQYTGVVIPGWGGGFYYPVPYYSEPAPQEAQQEEPVAAPPADQQASNLAASAPTTDQPGSAPSRSYNYAPTQPVEEYVFVKRDGTRIFAVAYSLTKDKLQYVTKEGLRRSLPLDALDYDATMKSNEERGNTVTLPGAPPAAMAMLK